VGQAISDTHPKLKQFKDGQLIQKQVALKPYKRANVLPGPCGLRDISGGVYEIVVIDFDAGN
jgi:hypothetical protein